MEIQRIGKRRIKSPYRPTNRVATFLKLVGWSIIGLSLLLIIILFIIIPIELAILPIPILLTYIASFAWASGNLGLEFVYALYLGGRTLFELQTISNNLFTLLAPSLATLSNALFKLLELFFVGMFNLICDVQPGETEFDAIVNCPILTDWMLIAPDVVEILIFVIKFIIFITNLFVAILLPSYCIKRDAPPTFPYFIEIDHNCTIVCGEVGLPGECQSFTVFLTWTLQDIQNPFHIILNIIDVVLPFIFGEIFTALDRSGLNHSLGLLLQPLTLFDLFDLIIKTDGEVLFAMIGGLFINAVAVIIDLIYCVLFTGQFGPCFFTDVCKAILPGFLEGACRKLGSGPCLCRRYESYYTYLDPFLKAPCTTFAILGCDPKYTIINELIDLWLSKIPNIIDDLT